MIRPGRSGREPLGADGREELARRLHRIFIGKETPAGLEAVPHATLIDFAADILAGDYTDPKHGPREGDGGEPMALVPRRWVVPT